MRSRQTSGKVVGMKKPLWKTVLVLVMRRKVCDDRPECEKLPAHLRDGDCCPAD